jgi:hypothetical protein
MSVLVIYSFVINVIFPIINKNQIPRATLILSESNRNEGKKVALISDGVIANCNKNDWSKLFELNETEEFLQSKLNLVDDDSVYLIIDLIKKTANLEMKGILLHQCPVTEYHISNAIRCQPAEQLLNWLASPFALKHDVSTIPKVSFIVKIAPKDTIEANMVEEFLTPPKRGDVYIVMDFERNLRLIIKQREQPGQEILKHISKLRWENKKIEIFDSLNALIYFHRATAIPTIEIILSKADATMLYRALPYKTKLLLRLEYV